MRIMKPIVACLVVVVLLNSSFEEAKGKNFYTAPPAAPPRACLPLLLHRLGIANNILKLYSDQEFDKCCKKVGLHIYSSVTILMVFSMANFKQIVEKKESKRKFYVSAIVGSMYLGGGAFNIGLKRRFCFL
ncbi:unnamed protein product [Arabis nemorensis]|uniref:Uncharacterized protein n=1 Tax=Arabis nemorensis TaxID=586526 RepID=A0A565BLW7_9BRAS|nr:unnamed protein product [Arabis nemorensis]